MTLAELLELRLRERVVQKLKSKMKNSGFEEFTVTFASELDRQREALIGLLLDQLDLSPAAAPEPELEKPAPGVKLQPTPEIITKAEDLQRLAMSSPNENERAAAWNAFEKLWQKYVLPSNLGMPR